jgi:alpha-ketoglutarate-dependent taurine dioxygenase
VKTITTDKLTPTVGVQINGLDADQLLNDPAIPEFIWGSLRTHGVLLFRDLGLTPEAQVRFSERLGTVDAGRGDQYGEPGVMLVSMDPKKNGGQETIKGTFNWHMDGCTLAEGRYPAPATILTCAVTSEIGGRTSFASTRAFFDSLTADEQQRLSELRVVHSIAGTRRRVIEDPTPEQEAAWAAMGCREHPLVWMHSEGLPSLVIGGTSENIVGWELKKGVEFLDDLVARATTPDRVYTHDWMVGDTVIWDNPGMLHSVEPYEDGSKREMVRCTLVGVEPTEQLSAVGA